jgi:hypothetical protein
MKSSNTYDVFRQQMTKMWLYLGPSDPDHSFSEELSDGEINTRILKVLDHGVNLNSGASPDSFRERVANTRVSLSP